MAMLVNIDSSDGKGENAHRTLKWQNEQLKMKVALMGIEMNDRRSEALKTDEPTIKSSLSGCWKIVHSYNVNKYLEALGAHSPHQHLFNTIFQLANAHLEFHGDAVTLYHQVGTQKHYPKTVTLSQQQFYGNSTASVSYICENAMKTVYIASEDVTEEEKRFIVRGRLYVMMRRNGVECTRIYERLIENDNENSVVVDELNVQIKMLSISLKKEKEASKGLEEEVKRLKRQLESIPIHIGIVGKWQNIKEPTDILSLTIENNLFLEYSHASNSKSWTTFDEHGAQGFFMSIEGNRIVRRESFGLKRKMGEYFIKNEHLFVAAPESLSSPKEYRKIGAPE